MKKEDKNLQKLRNSMCSEELIWALCMLINADIILVGNLLLNHSLATAVSFLNHHNLLTI
jgi:hypothetical protein